MQFGNWRVYIYLWNFDEHQCPADHVMEATGELQIEVKFYSSKRYELALKRMISLLLLLHKQRQKQLKRIF
jgi:hypothetical protein